MIAASPRPTRRSWPTSGRIARAFPSARTLLHIVGRMHREPVRSPARSVANLEFHRAGHDIDAIARRIVRRLEDAGVRALNPAMAFPMELDNFPERGWIVSHKRVAEAAGPAASSIRASAASCCPARCSSKPNSTPRRRP